MLSATGKKPVRGCQRARSSGELAAASGPFCAESAVEKKVNRALPRISLRINKLADDAFLSSTNVSINQVLSKPNSVGGFSDVIKRNEGEIGTVMGETSKQQKGFGAGSSDTTPEARARMVQ